MRRAIDITVAVTLLVLLLPILLAVAVIIRLDSPGPALFWQRRLGRGMEPFDVLKFRTMKADADAALHRDYVASLIKDAPAAVGTNGLYKLGVDSRVTRVGRSLRSWSVDELPQLWNVLRGDMSLVGPRPVIAYEADMYPAWYGRRFEVKPGMTGLWQVSGRNQRTYEEMVQFDIQYVDCNSLFLDLKIFVKTPWVVLGRKGVA